ncbi:PIR Superfamily Protein [Plasmodium ovale wallikeri]|uniref:PIR Superfamily Protein n=1 Tax=Plasmodium ovale wallikeri TaxID=864142 RepID=A0A1A9A8N3_PLAOA|nr:PIR Superfamily Protein [Plasmodium ovale wallikeri]
MVDPAICRKKAELQKSTFPSNIFLKTLYKDNDINLINEKIQSYKSDNQYDDIFSKIKEQFEKIRVEIREYYNDDEAIFCRNLNYYFDLLNATIISTNVLPKDIKDKLIGKVEELWKQALMVKNIYVCIREKTLDSIRKRSILKQLNDLSMDAVYIKINLEEYKNYLVEKWNKIVSYTDTQLGGLYIKVENDSMGIIEKYNDFLFSPEYICEGSLDKLNIDDITISTDVNSFVNTISLDNLSPNKTQGACYNKSYIDMLKTKTSSIQKMNNLLSIGIVLLGFSLILILLFNFSPLGGFLRRFAKKKIKVDENMSEEVMSGLYDDSENERPYIAYHSVSH